MVTGAQMANWLPYGRISTAHFLFLIFLIVILIIRVVLVMSHWDPAPTHPSCKILFLLKYISQDYLQNTPKGCICGDHLPLKSILEPSCTKACPQLCYPLKNPVPLPNDSLK